MDPATKIKFDDNLGELPRCSGREREEEGPDQGGRVTHRFSRRKKRGFRRHIVVKLSFLYRSSAAAAKASLSSIPKSDKSGALSAIRASIEAIEPSITGTEEAIESRTVDVEPGSHDEL